MLGFQAAGAAPLVRRRASSRSPETIASAIRIGNPARWEEAMAAMTESRGASSAVTDEEILDAYRFLAAARGRLLRAGQRRARRRAAEARRAPRASRGSSASSPATA